MIISTPTVLPLFRKLLGDGSNLGLKFSYAEQPSPDGLAQAFHIAGDCGFLKDEPAALVLGDNLFYGHDLVRSLERAGARTTGATIFGYHVADPKSYGVVEFAPDGRVLSLEEKPAQPKSNYAIPGIYFYDRDVVAFFRGAALAARRPQRSRGQAAREGTEGKTGSSLEPNRPRVAPVVPRQSNWCRSTSLYQSARRASQP